jgi:DNA-binding NtrC family response regulator
MQGKSILIVDDEEDLRDVIAARFEMEGCTVVKAENGSAAVAQLRARGFDAVISDIRMPGLGGIELMKLACALSPAPAVIMITGNTVPNSKEILKFGAAALLTKPFDLDDVIQVVYKAILSKP